MKVRPYEDDSEEESANGTQGRVQSRGYSPADETPIQREIRLASEREQLLRQSRGLPVLSSRTSVITNRRSEVFQPTEQDDIDHRSNIRYF